MPRPPKRLPVVHDDRVYEQNYATRKAIADAARAELEAAIAACGQGADAYGRHLIHDKLGLESTKVIYCRRDNGRWSPGAPDCEERILRQAAWVIRPNLARYETHSVTVPAGRFAEYAVTHFPRRYEVLTSILSFEIYKPRTPEQLKTAAEHRRTKALTDQEAKDRAEREAEAERRRIQPTLFSEDLLSPRKEP